jgi:hypothetical protein
MAIIGFSGNVEENSSYFVCWQWKENERLVYIAVLETIIAWIIYKDPVRTAQ